MRKKSINFGDDKQLVMLSFDLDPRVEAFSTEKTDALRFPVLLPRRQSHGLRSLIVKSLSDEPFTDGVDALITCEPGLRIGVKTADCVPVLLYDPSVGAVSAIHSGWKGTLGNIAGLTAKRIVEDLGGDAAQMKALIGPCIHVEAFEVGEELYDQFSKVGRGAWCHWMPRLGSQDNEKWHIDLPGICESQLREEGVIDIEKRPECTFTLPDRFWSARRLGPDFADQRILSCISLLP